MLYNSTFNSVYNFLKLLFNNPILIIPFILLLIFLCTYKFN